VLAGAVVMTVPVKAQYQFYVCCNLNKVIQAQDLYEEVVTRLRAIVVDVRFGSFRTKSYGESKGPG